MIGAHQTEKYFAKLDNVLPNTVFVQKWDAEITKASIIGTIRNDLLPYIVGGKNYRRHVDDNLSRAIRAFQQEDGEGTIFWLGCAVKGAHS